MDRVILVNVDGSPMLVAHDGVDIGNPIKIGGKANANEPAAVSASGDRVDAWFDLLGRFVTAPWHPGELTTATLTKSATGDATFIAAPGGGQSLYICSIIASNGGATLSRLILKEGAGGTVKWEAWLAVNGTSIATWYPTRPWKLPANVALTADISAATTDIRATVDFFTAP